MRRRLLMFAIIPFLITLTSCSDSKLADKLSEPFKPYNSSQISTNVNSEIEAFKPVSKTLSDEEKALLPYYGYGWTFIYSENAYNGVRDIIIYYLGQEVGTISGRYEIFSNIVALDDYRVCFFATDRDDENLKPRSNETISSLYIYDIKTDTYTKLQSREYLKKYGIFRSLISDGKNIYLLYKANSWTNVVAITADGQDSLSCKIPNDKIYIDNVKGWILQADGTFMVSDSHGSYNVDITTGNIKKNDYIVDSKSIFGNNSYFNFLPSKAMYISEKVDETDELTGDKYFKQIVYEVDGNNKRNVAQIGVSQFGKLECEYITSKYLFFLVGQKGYSGLTYLLIDLDTGEAKYIDDLFGRVMDYKELTIDLWNAYTTSKVISLE
ncbi:MAG: hypothetical protein N2749_04815 [Clostridia bacterium]|nr:hypothetical protein [Clostridia bacterium]